MTGRKVVGGMLLALPFIAVFYFAATKVGLWQVAATLGLTVLIVACISSGVILLVRGRK